MIRLKILICFPLRRGVFTNNFRGAANAARFSYSAIGAENLPVFVWIHGGGYATGSAQTDMNFLAASQNMVFVAIQYRLNVLGNLALNSDDSWGNFGLFDQRLGLEWIKNEISLFGGNPDDIQIGGESAGAGSVSAQTRVIKRPTVGQNSKNVGTRIKNLFVVFAYFRL